MLVQAQVGDQLFELSVLILELLQAPQLANAETTVNLLPSVERLLRIPSTAFPTMLRIAGTLGGSAHPADDLGHRRARLRLLQREGDLLVRVPRLLHVLGGVDELIDVGSSG